MNSVSDVQVTLLLPLLRAPELEQLTLTTVPGTTGNFVVVLRVLLHSAFSPVQEADRSAVQFIQYNYNTKMKNVTQTNNYKFSRSWIFKLFNLTYVLVPAR